MIITSGIHKGRKIVVPDENVVRPTLSKVRESVFSVLYSLGDFSGKSFLDLFSGSGIMGLEALSRGFDSALAFEKSPKVAKIIRSNYQSLKIEPNLKLGDSLKLLDKTKEKFDVIYVDPPYFSGIYEQVLQKIAQNNLLKNDGIIVLEHVDSIDFEQYGFSLIKEKTYSSKKVTFLKLSD